MSEKQPLAQAISGRYGSNDNINDQSKKGDHDDDGITNYQRSSFTIIAFAIQIVLIILYAVAVDYPNALLGDDNESTEDNSNYVYFQQVNVMMFIGFGYLMTFLRRYSFSAITLNMMLTVLCIQWGMFMVGLVDVLFTHEPHKLTLSVDMIAQGDIAAAVILISFGAVLGRTTPAQLLVMGVLEIILYAVNQYIVTEILFVTDVGGSIIIHTFGCYFGLAVSFVLGQPKDEEENHSEYRADLFSMIGTVFLWLYWPSFNGIFPNSAFSSMAFSQTRAFLNTVLSLCSCTVCTLGLSVFVENGHIDMVHIQNSTLAGGVAAGAAANLFLTPAGAMIVGLVAACVSVFGFKYMSDILESKLRVWDTCGVHNLHGMPGILGGIVSAIAIACGTTTNYPPSDVSFYYSSFSEQAGYQMVGVCVTLAISIVGGLVVGWILKNVKFAQVTEFYSDKEFFSLPKIMDIYNKIE